MVSSNSKFWKLLAIDFLLRKHWWLHWTRLHQPEIVPYLQIDALTGAMHVTIRKESTITTTCNYACNIMQLYNLRIFGMSSPWGYHVFPTCSILFTMLHYVTMLSSYIDKTILDAAEHQWNYVRPLEAMNKDSVKVLQGKIGKGKGTVAIQRLCWEHSSKLCTWWRSEPPNLSTRRMNESPAAKNCLCHMHWWRSSGWWRHFERVYAVTCWRFAWTAQPSITMSSSSNSRILGGTS